MAEIANVVGGEIIASEWGNDIRDRVVMRYATVGALPVADDGSVAYVDATDKLYLRRAGAWVIPGAVGYVAQGLKTTSQGGIFGVADITGLSASFTALPNRYYKVSVVVRTSQESVAGLQNVTITDGSNAQLMSSQISVADGFAAVHALFVVHTPTAGAFTYKARGQTSAGTMAVFGAGGSPGLLLVEDIGPA